MSASTLLLAVLLVQAQASPAPGQVRGVVRGGIGGEGAPLPYALVEASGASHSAVLADSMGHYVLGPLAPGLHRVRALHVGYAPLEVDILVPAGGEVRVDMDLLRDPVALPGLTVTGAPLGDPPPEGGGRGALQRAFQSAEVALRSLAATPGLAESGVAGAAQALGGDGTDPRDVLLMRGSTADLKLVLLDGAPVYTPFHVGGLIESFDPAAFGSATLHLGGAPARYDGGLSYILDLRTRAPRGDGLHASGALDLLSARASVEGPLGPAGSILVSGRALHGLEGPLLGGAGSPYGYRDALVRWRAAPAPGHSVSLTAFLNDESVYLDFPAAQGLALRSRGAAPPDAARWGNRALSAAYAGLAGGTSVDVGAAASRYEAELPVRPGGAGGDLVVARGQTDRIRLTADLSRPWAGGRLRFGAALEGVDIDYGARRLATAATSASRTSGSGSMVGAYVDVSHPLAPGLDLRTGLRADRFSPGGGFRLAPRAALTWTLAPRATLTLAGGRYHQYTRAPDAQVAEMASQNGGAGEAERLLRVATADHLVLSLDQVLVSDVRLGLDGFVKSFRGVSGGSERITSSGLDLRVVRRGEDLAAWLGYSLSWFWAEDRSAGPGTTTFTGRHLLSAGIEGRVAGPVGIDVRLSFSDGLPFTSLPLGAEVTGAAGDVEAAGVESVVSGGPVLGGPTEGFLRLDAEVHALWTAHWAGRDVTIRPYVRVINALARRDALFWYFQPWRDAEARPLADLSILPVLGLEWRF